MIMTNEKSNEFVHYILKYYDLSISVCILVLLFLNLVMTSFYFLYEVLNIAILSVLIIIIDLIFNFELLIKISSLRKIMSNKSRYILEKFIKGLLYLIILTIMITAPPGVPTTFFLPVASIDYYFLLLVLILTGLYYSIYPVLKTIFEKNLEQTT